MRVSVVTITVHSCSENDGRRAAEQMYGGALTWMLKNNGDWEGSSNLDGPVATVRMQQFDVQSSATQPQEQP